MTKLSKAAKRAVEQALKIKRNEKVLLVTDGQKLPIAKEFAKWADNRGAETTTYLMTETLRPISKPTSRARPEIDSEHSPAPITPTYFGISISYTFSR